MKDKLKKVGTAIVNFVKAIPSFVKSTPKKLHNLVAPKNVTWPSMHNTLHRTGAVFVVSAVSAVIIGIMDAAYALLLHVPFLFV